MAGIKDKLGIKEQLHIVLTGPDGKVKDERKPRVPIKRQEVRNVTGKRPGIREQNRD